PDRLTTGLDRGRLTEKRGGLREHPLAIGGRHGARPVDKRSYLDQPRAVSIERERIGRDARREEDPDDECEKKGARQDCGSASAASCRSKASLRTRRS